MRPTLKNTLLTAACLAWGILTLALSAFANRPGHVQIASLTAWPSLAGINTLIYGLELLAALSGAGVFSLACFLLGLRLIGPLTDSSKSRLALAASAFVTGEIVFSLLFLGLISLVRLTPPMVAGLLIGGSLAGLPALRAFIARPLRWRLPDEFSPAEQLIAALLLSLLLLALLYSTARLSYDSLVEYFSHARIMAVTRQAIFFYYKDSFVVSSFHPGILFTALIQLFGDQAARLFSWVNGLTILILGLALARETGLRPRAQLYFLTLMLSSTAFVDLLGDGKIELISTAPILAGIYWMLLSLKNPTRSTFTLIGLLVGFALIARPYNLFLVTLFVGIFYAFSATNLWRTNPQKFKTLLATGLWSLPPLLALGLFHLQQNWIWLGSPLAPLTYARELGAKDWQWQFDPATLTTLRLFYPLTVSFFNSPQSLGTLSPLLVGFLPFALMKDLRRNLFKSPSLQSLTVPALLTLTTWVALFFTIVEIRYVFFLWILLFLVVACWLETLLTPGLLLMRPIFSSLIVLTLAGAGFRILLIAAETYSPQDSTGNAHCTTLHFCTFFDPLNQDATPGERILALNAYRYYLRPDLFACSARAEEYPQLEALAQKNSGEFWVAAYRMGFRSLLYEKNFAQFHSRFGTLPDPKTAPAWLSVTLLSTNSYDDTIYRLEAHNPPFQPEKTCQLDDQSLWQVIPTN